MHKKKLNWLEKHLAGPIRNRMTTMIITALGLFLALQYNETIKAIFDKIFPLQGEGIMARIIYVILLTFVIVFITIFIEKVLDGKPD